MDAIATLKDELFEEMEVGLRTTKGLIEKIELKDWGYRPIQTMRSLLELTNHLIQIPAIDLNILKEEGMEKIRGLEKALFSEDPQTLVKIMEEGYKALKSYMESLTVSDFLEKRTKPFYFGEELTGKTQSQWLIEIITHLFHHRAQVFTYLKQLGYDVSMMDLY